MAEITAPATVNVKTRASEASVAEKRCDLTPCAGQTVGLAFRYFSDSNTHGDGFWVDDVMIDDTLISDGSTLEGWQSATEFNPVEVEAYTVRLIAYGNGNKAWIGQLSMAPRPTSWPRSSR